MLLNSSSSSLSLSLSLFLLLRYVKRKKSNNNEDDENLTLRVVNEKNVSNIFEIRTSNALQISFTSYIQCNLYELFDIMTNNALLVIRGANNDNSQSSCSFVELHHMDGMSFLVTRDSCNSDTAASSCGEGSQNFMHIKKRKKRFGICKLSSHTRATCLDRLV